MIDHLQGILLELGVRLLRWRAEGAVEGVWQGTQFKAEADLRSHDFISAGLLKAWPDIPVVSEEDAASLVHPRPDRYWLIDPIDGTASFCNGFDGFVTQAALIKDKKPVLSVVHAPALGLTYCGSGDGDATCNGRVLRLEQTPPARPVLIDNYPEPRGIAQALFQGLPCGGYVESGSLGLKICRVADGTADLFVKDVVVKDWDLAPADLILRLAGGVLTTLAGEDIPYAGDYARQGIVAAANTGLAVQVDRWLKDAGPSRA
ncbi:3'(2'),5'-bisphosphate nucleotidase CysQ [Devosia ginsengisoli]|uniref:3'(2'),5'-bisphosphate nucleotidase CysQ family protein n=1 Tax=Devosia ginsengisoli TaxID=400770 RepID=UPI0026EEC172|nr:inositol monophosphatase family protein [Devosia ginsengisoli]MCR6672049.1 hypothetical protein [Devosia ginsengisoli]